MIKTMEKEEEYEEGVKQTSDNTESVGTNEEDPSTPHLDAPDSNIQSPSEEEDEEHREKRKQEYEELMCTYRELLEQREKATRRNIQLQMKLSEYFSKKGGDDGPPEKMSYEELLGEFQKCSKIQADLKQKIRSEVTQLEEKLNELDNERKALSKLLSKEESRAAAAAAARVDLQLQQVIELFRQNNKLRMRISRLTEQLSVEKEQPVDPLLLQFKQLQLARLEQERNCETLEKYSKVQRTLVSSLERLTNVKAKLDFSQREVQAKRGQLGEADATLAEKRDIFCGIRKTREKLQRDNLRLRERQGLLGNKGLLRDFEDTMDASELLEERLQHLKAQHAQIGRKAADS